MARNPDLKKAAAVRFWNVPFLAVVLLKSVVQCQDAAYTCVGYGDTATLSCDLDLTGGLTITTLQWRKEGLTPNDLVAGYAGGTTTPGPAYTGRVTINPTGDLLLTNVQEDDEGTYTCTGVILSDFSQPPDHENLLRKTGTPTNIRCTTPHTTVNASDEATLTCSSDPGCPPAQHTWVKKPINDHISITGGNLLIAYLIKDHKGIYECTVSNTHGSGQCQLDLTVQYPPERPGDTPIQKLLKYIYKLFGSGRLEALPVDAFPPAVIVWKKSDTQDVRKRAGTGSDNVVKRSNETYYDVIYDSENAGTYTCTAENMLGSTPCGEFDVNMAEWRLALLCSGLSLFVGIVIVALVVIYCKKSRVLPKAPAEIQLQPVPSSQKVVMQWTAKSEGSYNIQYRPRGSDDWTKVDVSTNSHPYYKHTVDFQQDGDYEVCVLVINAKGETKSDIKQATVKASGHAGEADSPV